MFSKSAAFLLPLLLLAPHVLSEHGDHGHHDKEQCGCAATEDGWTINCVDTSIVTTSYNALVSNGCNASNTICESDTTCASDFRKVQAHHDYCGADKLPTFIEIGYHSFAENCDGCIIARKFNTDLPVCDAVQCEASNKTTIQTTAINFLEANCMTNCTDALCSTYYGTIVTFHDTCDEDDLVADLEHTLHEVEEVCALPCNTATAAFDPMVCDHTTSPTTSSPSPSPTASPTSSATSLVAHPLAIFTLAVLTYITL